MTSNHDPQLLKGVLTLLLLHLLAEQESYGYQVVQRLHLLGLTDVLEGTVYPALSRLEREGRLTSRLVASQSGPARKYYRPTDAGLQALAEGTTEWASLAALVTDQLTRPIPAVPSKGTDMSTSISWLDRLRIERVVWMLDQQLYDLPSKSRVAKRREVRENLLTAAHDVGTTEALRNLGTSSQLAHEYLAASSATGLGTRGSMPPSSSSTSVARADVPASPRPSTPSARHDGRRPDRVRHVPLGRPGLPAVLGDLHARRRLRRPHRRRDDAAVLPAPVRRHGLRRQVVAGPLRCGDSSPDGPPQPRTRHLSSRGGERGVVDAGSSWRARSPRRRGT